MRSPAGDINLPTYRAFVGVDHLHVGWLADDCQARPRNGFRKFCNHRPHAEAADFFVIRKRNVNGRLERAALEVRHGCQHTGEKSLHIASAAAIKLPALRADVERIAVPGLALNRHYVGMA